MNQATKTIVMDAYHSAWKGRFSGSIPEWAAQQISLGPVYAIPGSFDVSRSKYMVQPFDSLQDHNCRQVNICSSVQSGKSLISEIFLGYTISQGIGNLLLLCQTDEMAQKAAETRINPLLRNTEDIKALLPNDRYAIKKRSVIMPHASLWINGAKESVLQSLTIKTLIGDEVYLYDQGFLSQAKARTYAYSNTKKIFFLSTAGTIGDDWDTEYNRGIVHDWSWNCPSCSFVQPYHFNKQRPDGSWAGLNWSAVKYANGDYNFRDTAKSARLSCFGCKYIVKDTPVNRRKLNDSGSYTIVKDGDPDIHSYHWNSLAAIDIKWSSLVIEYLQAKQLFKQTGYIIPLQDFHQKKLSVPWNENAVRPDVKAAISDFDSSKDWPDERLRIMSIDVQQDHLWFSVYAFSDKSEVRLLDWGKLTGWGDVEAKRIQWNVRHQHCCTDVGYNQSLIAAKSLEFGHEGLLQKKKFYYSMICLKGSKSHYFNHLNKNTKQTDKRLYSELQWIDPAAGKTIGGKKAPLYQWSNYSIKHIVNKLLKGKIGKIVVSKEDPEWTKQVNSEVLKKVVNAKTGVSEWLWTQIREDNHALDCLCMALVMAIIANVFSLGSKEEEMIEAETPTSGSAST